MNKLICASNRNNVLTDFFGSGTYSTHRTFFKTMSPSMDILVSSNLERLLYEATDRDGALVRTWMDQLKECGSYDYAIELADKYTNEAIACLDCLKDSDDKTFMVELARFAMSRDV